ncbi:hypothetical protein HZ993_08435 [Rhodoferax sp. AJA081-3]|uniref:hypothetical protein n=1 Tax=Rhodoferax sp. AJA081-3 TaxID=2752316 RepID=UPI001ADFEFCE|nr:hypothetical protein [Rhodoferax sp. AJA081-3]QTN29823.1 hypothetical protein HZ993_08435 [Rhodoferax sp. AJA081-3]
MTNRPKSIVSIGTMSNLVVPSELAYAGALQKLIQSARDLHIQIDLATFYSEEPIELHNFVDTVTYRFMIEDGEPFLAYEVSTHHGGVYREVAYTGEEIRSWSVGVNLNENREELCDRAKRVRYTLGIGIGG